MQIVRQRNVACSVLGIQKYMCKLAVKMDNKSLINYIDPHTRTLKYSFTKRVKPLRIG